MKYSTLVLALKRLPDDTIGKDISIKYFEAVDGDKDIVLENFLIWIDMYSNWLLSTNNEVDRKTYRDRILIYSVALFSLTNIDKQRIIIINK